MSLRPCTSADLPSMYEIINDAAQAYKGVIPADRWHEPYMPMAHLESEIRDGVRFWGHEIDGELVGVMGSQDRGEVCLIRHAYVRTSRRNSGSGTKLLKQLEKLAGKPILIGTWAAAAWAIRFYEKNGYRLVANQEKEMLLKKYWRIPEQQLKTSVVLASADFR
jgi:N-acetylglutamate synthase-like GNAT family acetyltransferase